MRPRHLRGASLNAALCAILCTFLGFCALTTLSQSLDKPLQNIDEDITAFAFSPIGHLAYSVRRQFHTKQYDLQRDDIWVQDPNGKRRILLKGEKFTHGTAPFTYTVDSFRWSPNGHGILAELFTTSVIDETGRTQDAPMTMVLEDSGKEIRLGAGDNVIQDSVNPTWLLDSTTIVYLAEAVKPRILYSFKYLNVAGGPTGPVFEGRTFLDSSAIPRTNLAIAVERDRNLTGPPRLQRLELLAQDDHELATLDSYSGGLTVSPGGKRVAYFLDKEVLEVRDLTNPHLTVRLRVGLGVFQWAPDETRILLKRAVEKKSGDLVWIDIPQLADHSVEKDPPVLQPVPVPVFHDLTFRDFGISPDGRFLGVVLPGRRNLSVYPLPQR